MERDEDPATGTTRSTHQSLVTGGCGFVGSHLVRLLARRGHRVRVLDLADPGNDAMRGVEYRRGSILDESAVREAVDGCTHVFHLAADPNLWHPDPSSFHAVNAVGTANVLAAAERAGVRRIVHTSTESILFGRRGSARIIDERCRPGLDEVPGPYCRSKLRAEHHALAAAERGVPVVVVNPTLPVGPGDRRITPPTRMIIDFLNGRHPAFLDFHANLVDVRSVAEGHWLAALHGEVGQRYILAGENLALSELLSRLERLSGRTMPRTRIPYAVALAYAAVAEWVADHVTHRPPSATVAGVRLAGASAPFSADLAREALGWRCRPTDESLGDLIGWLHAEGHLADRGLETNPGRSALPHR